METGEIVTPSSPYYIVFFYYFYNKLIFYFSQSLLSLPQTFSISSPKSYYPQFTTISLFYPTNFTQFIYFSNSYSSSKQH